jgi:hypothetical protein
VLEHGQSEARVREQLAAEHEARAAGRRVEDAMRNFENVRPEEFD